MTVALTFVTVLSIAGCSSGASGASFEPSPTAGASGAVVVHSADEAANLVLTRTGKWPGLGPFDPNTIGQCCGYRVSLAAVGWTVTIEVGWGDCPAGCIDRHQWRYEVHPDGTIVDLGETGPAVPAGLPGGGSPGGSPAPSAAGGQQTEPPFAGPGILGIALAGPTCPVMRPGESGCEDRPVGGATVHVIASDGVEVATLTTRDDGRFQVELDPGTYRLVADPVPGIMGTAPPQDVTVGGSAVTVQLSYDTGIR